MILDFRMKDYVCNYIAGRRYYNTICFSEGCKGGSYNKAYHATLMWPKDKQEELNYCYFDKDVLIEYFSEISRILGFKLISFQETEHRYKLQIETPVDHRYFIYCAMCIRYVYEHPFALLLHAAWNNRKNLPDLDIIQIMQFYLALFFNGRRCHCPGLDNLAFYNINSKCQFNLIRDNFNRETSFISITSKYLNLCNAMNSFNTKQLTQISQGINKIANIYYDKRKKDLCRW